MRNQLKLPCRVLICLAAYGVSTVGAACDTQAPVLTSAERGVPFHLLVTETERWPTKSYLNVPGFHQRTAPGSRSLMCFYTALAIEREFSYWFVVYPAEGSNRVVLAFSNSALASPEDLLGSDYVKALALGKDMMPVDKMSALCGIPAKH